MQKVRLCTKLLCIDIKSNKQSEAECRLTHKYNKIKWKKKQQINFQLIQIQSTIFSIQAAWKMKVEKSVVWLRFVFLHAWKCCEIDVQRLRVYFRVHTPGKRAKVIQLPDWFLFRGKYSEQKMRNFFLLVPQFNLILQWPNFGSNHCFHLCYHISLSARKLGGLFLLVFFSENRVK